MLYFVSTPIGNLQDVTLRALETLDGAEIVICEDTRVSKKLYTLLKTKNLLQNIPETFLPFHSHNEDAFIQNIDKAMFEKNVVFMSDAGMPCISDPGAKLVAFCQKEGIRYDIIPGASALDSAYAMSGFLDTRFCFYGFLPHKAKSRIEELLQILQSGGCTVLYESPHRIQNLAQELNDIAPNCELFAIKEITKAYQSFFKGNAEAFFAWLKQKNTNGEWVVIVKGRADKEATITLDMLKNMDLPPKIFAKIVAKVTGKKPKECYETLLNEKN